MLGSTLLFGIIALTTSTALAQPTELHAGRGLARSPNLYRRHQAHSGLVNKLKRAPKNEVKAKHCRVKPKPKEQPKDDGPKGSIISVQEPRCGPNGATSKITQGAGPNGAEKWLNCGIDSPGGWNPPKLTVDDIVFVSLDDALKQDNSPFKTCNKYIGLFNKYAEQNNIPAIFLAVFALQESSCNPRTRGQGGEAGMFQLSDDKCPGGHFTEACLDPETNTRIAAKFIKTQLDMADGSLLLMIGRYNGWDLKLTRERATRAANGDCCYCQNNLDYLFQWSIWILGKDAYALGVGTEKNLSVCSNKRELLTLEERREKMNMPKRIWKF